MHILEKKISLRLNKWKNIFLSIYDVYKEKGDNKLLLFKIRNIEDR